jgi:hypothetical protein
MLVVRANARIDAEGQMDATPLALGQVYYAFQCAVGGHESPVPDEPANAAMALHLICPKEGSGPAVHKP